MIVVPGDERYNALALTWQVVGGSVFQHDGEYYQRLTDNDVVYFVWLPPMKDRGHPRWFRYRGPQETPPNGIPPDQRDE